MAPVAFGILRLPPSEFYTMTPAEVYAAAIGWERKHRSDLNVVAWSVGHIIAPNVKKSQRPGLIKRLFGVLVGKPIQDHSALPSFVMADKKKSFWESVRKKQARKAEAASSG